MTGLTSAFTKGRRALATLLANLPGMVYRRRSDPDWPVEFASEGALTLTGHAPEEFVQRRVAYGDLIHPEDRQRVWDEVQSALARRVAFQLEYRIRTAAGELKWVWEQGCGVYGRHGREALEGYVTDITELVSAKAERVRSEELYRSFLSAAPFGFYRSSPKGRFQEVNPALVAMLGYDTAEDVLLLDMAKDIYRNKEDRPRLLDRYGGQEGFEGVVVEWKRRNDASLTVRLSGRPVQDIHGKLDHFEVIVEDVTRQKQIEERLHQSEKLRAIGTLASGVAHDFNNILTIILGNVEVLRHMHRHVAPFDEALGDVRKAAERAAALVQQLLAFGRQQLLVTAVCDLNEIVSGTMQMLGRLINEDVEIATELAPAPCWVRVDRSQIEQVLVNLAINARDAMPEGGRLLLRTGAVSMEWGDTRSADAAEHGEYVQLAVGDTGHGMAEEERQRIFEPFFSTKGAGEGTGLGLAMVYGTIKQSGGWVDVDSAPGQGTTFRVYLPRAAPPKPAVPREARRSSCPGGSETVLLVEDEEAIRSLATTWLRGKGYAVLDAADGREALGRARSHGQPIDLLVSDVVMPGLNGPALRAKLLKSHPAIRTLFVSGYSPDALARLDVQERRVPILRKPFDSEQFVCAVRKALDAPALL